MATLTEMVAAVVVHSSAAALSHFGVTVDVPKVEPRVAASERVVARTPRQAPARPARTEPAGLEKARINKASVCPDKARLFRA